MLRDISTCRRRKSIFNVRGTIGMPLWPEANVPTQAQPEHRGLDRQERTRLVERQDEQEHHDVRRQPDDDHRGLDPLLGPDPSLQQRPDTGGVEVEPFEGQQGKEEPALVADEPARQAAAPLQSGRR